MEPTSLHLLLPRRDMRLEWNMPVILISRQRPHSTQTLCLQDLIDLTPIRVLFNRNRTFLRLFLNTLTILWQPFQSWSNAPEGAYPREGEPCEILQLSANAKPCWV